MRYRFHTADVFTDQVFGGNPLAVFPEGGGLSDAQMQRVAREFNLSETVFVLGPDDPAHTCRLRIFTPGRELPFAGHPTIGTALVLAWIGKIPLAGTQTGVVFEEGVGPVAVTITARDGRAARAELSAARMPEYGPEPPARTVLAEMLSLAESDLLPGPGRPEDRPRAVSCGVPFLFVPVRGRDALRRAALRREVWDRILAAYWAPPVFVFSYDPEGAEHDIRARMFSPLMGIAEDPATGAAATALAGYLAPLSGTREGTLRWVVEQGFEMGRPSLLEVEADLAAGAVAAIRVAGAAVPVSHGEMEIPEVP
jgi:trans-2,3-dihydro-3-hydroxyanthranilate isomerase